MHHSFVTLFKVMSIAQVSRRTHLQINLLLITCLALFQRIPPVRLDFCLHFQAILGSILLSAFQQSLVVFNRFFEYE